MVELKEIVSKINSNYPELLNGMIMRGKTEHPSVVEEVLGSCTEVEILCYK